MPRPLFFELHIRPLFRELDRLHMRQFSNFDLWDYAAISDPNRAARILHHLQAVGTDELMPPASHGGPWPEEWVALFQRWIAEGRRGLDLGRATYTASIDEGFVTITASGNTPAAEDSIWLDRYFGTDAADLVLYQEMTTPANPPAPQAFDLTDYFPFDAIAQAIRIKDADGIHAVPFTAT